MSCGTCPDSAQPTTRQDGTAPTPGSLLWSADVGAWYRRQRAQGARPMIAMPAGNPAAARPALATPMQTAARQIKDALLDLTAYEFEVVPQEGDFPDWLAIRTDPPSPLLPEAQHAALAKLGLPVSCSQCSLSPEEWHEWAGRLEAVRQARTLLHYARQLGIPVQGQQAALVTSPEGTRLYRCEGVLLHTFSWRGEHAGTVPGGNVSYASSKYASERSATQALAELRGRAAYQHCLVCGTWQWPNGACPQCNPQGPQ